jgi:hypothetical protein
MQHPSTLGNTEFVVEGRFIEELEISLGATTQRSQQESTTTGSSRRTSHGSSSGSSIRNPTTPSRQTRSAAKLQQQHTDEILRHPLVVRECVEYVKQGASIVTITPMCITPSGLTRRHPKTALRTDLRSRNRRV